MRLSRSLRQPALPEQSLPVRSCCGCRARFPPLFRDWLEERYPGRAAKVMGHVRDMHGGKDYDAEWGKRMRGRGPYAAILRARFKLACSRLGLAERLEPLRSDLFAVPEQVGDQLSLF